LSYRRGRMIDGERVKVNEVTSLYTGGSSTSPSHPPPFDARPFTQSSRSQEGWFPLPPCVSPSPHRRCTRDATPHLRRPLWCVSRASANFRESWRRVGFATDAHGVGVGVGAVSTSTARSRRSRWSVRLFGLAGDDRLPLPAAGLCCSPGGVRTTSPRPDSRIDQFTEARTGCTCTSRLYL
jgi:hypothetical protein